MLKSRRSLMTFSNLGRMWELTLGKAVKAEDIPSVSEEIWLRRHRGTVGFEDFLLWVWQCIFMEERLGSACRCFPVHGTPVDADIYIYIYAGAHWAADEVKWDRDRQSSFCTLYCKYIKSDIYICLHHMRGSIFIYESDAIRVCKSIESENKPERSIRHSKNRRRMLKKKSALGFVS